MESTVLRALTVPFGLALSVIGLVGVPVAVLALLDPAGAQASNDVAPFDAPPSTVETLMHLGCFVAVAILGARLLRFAARPRHEIG